MSSGLGGKYRKQIYENVEAIIGRVLTKKEHATLRTLIKQHVNEKTEHYQKKITAVSADLNKCRFAFKKKHPRKKS